MSIKPILFLGVADRSHRKRELTFVSHFTKVLDRSKGIQTIFDVAINAFSWGTLASFSEAATNWMSQGRCIAELCKSAYQAYKAPSLFNQAVRLWNRGKGVKKSTVHFKNHLKANEWDVTGLKKLMNVAKEVFGWASSAVSWACRTIEVVKEAWHCAFSKELMATIRKVGSVASLVSFGLMTVSITQELADRASLPKTDNPLIQQVRDVVHRSMICDAVSTSARLMTAVSYGLRTFAFVLVPVAFSLTLSTIALSFSIRSIYLQSKCHLDSHFVRIPV